MWTALFLAVAGVSTLLLWLFKRYFSRGDTLKRLIEERDSVRNELEQELLRQKALPLSERTYDKYIQLDLRLQKLNRNIARNTKHGG